MVITFLVNLSPLENPYLPKPDASPVLNSPLICESHVNMLRRWCWRLDIVPPVKVGNMGDARRTPLLSVQE